MLGCISEEWRASSSTVPRYLITFKLETDEETLKKKAPENLIKYSCDAVVGNLLQNYQERVLVYWRGEEHRPIPLRRPEFGFIEDVMVDMFVKHIESETKETMVQIQ
ncbi:putative mucin-like glycoprotein [Trypanosoma conorhini]|uniref:Putative mucin-like glycoprotein n=1 Tax=Trypanosoma conorhini TaxID=83891 RepID=A0A3R7P291_9TRYP|nr:putative mucin-like glycoprotein [Trypanosoma conorhini]RNF27751.1 putative mucin-like glycoprotein [Trypanosoma conorhini]